MKFSIRDLLWLTVVIAALCGWYRERVNYKWSVAHLEKTIDRLCHERWILRDRHDFYRDEGIYYGQNFSTSQPQSTLEEFEKARGRK
jgi:hypothetical protein